MVRKINYIKILIDHSSYQVQVYCTLYRYCTVLQVGNVERPVKLRNLSVAFFLIRIGARASGYFKLFFQ